MKKTKILNAVIMVIGLILLQIWHNNAYTSTVNEYNELCDMRDRYVNDALLYSMRPSAYEVAQLELKMFGQQFVMNSEIWLGVGTILFMFLYNPKPKVKAKKKRRREKYNEYYGD